MKEQIEEMAKAICGLNTSEGCFCDGGYCNYNCLSYEKAEALYNAGYRKQSNAEKQKLEIWRLQGEVERLKAEKDALIKNYAECMKDYAREIFTEIEFDIHNLDFDREETRAIAIEGIIANAKKRYTEESNEV